MKKWLCFLLAFGFMSTPVWANDDEWEDDDEYEEEAPKKSSKAKAAVPKAKKKADGGESRMGLAANFVGGWNLNGWNGVGFVYDMGNIEIGVGLGVQRISYAEYTDPNGNPQADPKMDVKAVLGVSYALGKGLLDYGVGVDLGVTNRELGNDISGFPFFYTKANLLPNVSLKLAAGILVDKPALPDPVQNGNTTEMEINFATSAGIIFYFL